MFRVAEAFFYLQVCLQSFLPYQQDGEQQNKFTLPVGGITKEERRRKKKSRSRECKCSFAALHGLAGQRKTEQKSMVSEVSR